MTRGQTVFPIDGETEILGVLGCGISHTLSPRMHNAAARSLGVNAVYLPLDFAEPGFDDFLRSAWHGNFRGFNVTTPYKEKAAQATHGTAASVNTLYRGEVGWEATSTDAAGYFRGLRRLGYEKTDFENLVILGSGGVVKALLEEVFGGDFAPPSVIVLRRSARQDEQLDRIAGTELDKRDLTLENLRSALSGRGEETLFVQGTSAPLRGDDLGWLAEALSNFKGPVSDLVYGNPSALYFTALAQDLPAQDGEPMLIEQARLSQEYWWGTSAGYDLMASALRGKLP